jgi:ribosomal protein S18 acetylase RimI-like enzyme
VAIDEGFETWTTGERVADLMTLVVLPEARGRGVGSSLVESVYRELRGRGVRELAISVVHNNDDALRFYRRHARFEPIVVTLLGRVPERPEG